MNSRRLGALLLLVSASQVMADDEAGGLGHYFGDFPVVLSASRLAQPTNEAPAAVTVIDREMIRASGVREVADLLRLVPGMVVGRRSGHSPMLGFHGFGDAYFRQFQVLLDGVSIYSPLYGGVEWGALPLSLADIERIEVVRGPNAATYGANSFLGVVNIITRDPATDHRFQADVLAGENGIGDTAIRHARNLGDLRYRVSLGQRTDRGLDSLPDNRSSNFLNFRGHYRLDTRDELRLQFGYVGGYGEEGLYTGITNGPRPGRFETKSMQLRWTRADSADEELWVQLDHAERQHHERIPYTLNLGLLGTYDYPISYSYDHRRTDLEIQRTSRLRDGLRGVWGAQWREDGVRSPEFFYTQAWVTSRLVRLFGNLEWRPAESWLLHAGAMFETNTITGGSLSPSAALVYHLTPRDSLRLRIAKARRTPTLFENQVYARYDPPAAVVPLLGPLASLPLALTRRTVEDLVDEKILSREIAYVGEIPQLRASVDIRAFHDQARDLLSQYQYANSGTILGGVYNNSLGFRNGDHANVRGVGIDLRLRPWRGAAVTFAGSRTVIESNNGDTDWATSAPLHTVSLLFAQELPSEISMSLGYYRVGSMRWIGITRTDPLLPAVDRIDLRLAKRFRWGSHRAELSVVTQNTFDPMPVFQQNNLEKRTSWLRLDYEY